MRVASHAQLPVFAPHFEPSFDMHNFGEGITHESHVAFTVREFQGTTVAPRGPKWKDVRRMLNQDLGNTRAELRAATVISLCSIYALRSMVWPSISIRI